MKCLEDALFYGIENHKKDILQKTLRTFVVLDQSKYAENLVRIRLIQPSLNSILNQNSLKMEPQDLAGLFLKVKDFIKQKLKDLVEISSRYFKLVSCLFNI